MAKGSRNVTAWICCAIVSALVGAGGFDSVHAQGNRFGVRERAAAAERMIVLGVQQGISSLPPTSGQSYTYSFNPEVGAFERSEQLGPVSFRSTQTVGKGNLSLRTGVSYFELSKSLSPIDYRVDGPVTGGEPLRTRFGVDAEAEVVLLNVGANYGFGDAFELVVNLPLVLTSAKASEVFVSFPGSTDVAAVRFEPPDLIDRFLESGDLVVTKLPFEDVAGVDFHTGDKVRVGRASVGGKWLVHRQEHFELALAPEFFFPSPNEEDLAGSESAAILSRAIARVPVVDRLSVHLDAGYDLDFDHAELRRVVWNAGTSIALDRVTFDFGIGGSKFGKGIEWTPDEASFLDFEGNTNTITALESNQLGSNLIDFLGGAKAGIKENIVLSGAVNVPLNDEGFRAAAVGTVALEFYF